MFFIFLSNLKEYLYTQFSTQVTFMHAFYVFIYSAFKMYADI